VRSGQSRRTVQTISTQVARLATIATSRYASTWVAGRARSDVDRPLDSADHAGPYTARVLTQIEPTNFHSGSLE